MSAVRRGNEAERIVGKAGEAKGYLVGSRRHIAGPGDFLFVHPGGEVWLVEVKATKRPFDEFRPKDRAAMRAVLLPLVSARYLAHVKGSGKSATVTWIHERDWPD